MSEYLSTHVIECSSLDFDGDIGDEDVRVEGESCRVHLLNPSSYIRDTQTVRRVLDGVDVVVGSGVPRNVIDRDKLSEYEDYPEKEWGISPRIERASVTERQDGRYRAAMWDGSSSDTFAPDPYAEEYFDDISVNILDPDIDALGGDIIDTANPNARDYKSRLSEDQAREKLARLVGEYGKDTIRSALSLGFVPESRSGLSDDDDIKEVVLSFDARTVTRLLNEVEGEVSSSEPSGRGGGGRESGGSPDGIDTSWAASIREADHAAPSNPQAGFDYLLDEYPREEVIAGLNGEGTLAENNTALRTMAAHLSDEEIESYL